MNGNQIINMVIRMVMRQLIGKGINAGINAAARKRGKDGEPGPVDAESAKRMKQAARVTRRMGRF